MDLWYPLKIWPPKNITNAHFGHRVSKSWVRPCFNISKNLKLALYSQINPTSHLNSFMLVVQLEKMLSRYYDTFENLLLDRFIYNILIKCIHEELLVMFCLTFIHSNIFHKMYFKIKDINQSRFRNCRHEWVSPFMPLILSTQKSP